MSDTARQLATGDVWIDEATPERDRDTPVVDRAVPDSSHYKRASAMLLEAMVRGFDGSVLGSWERYDRFAEAHAMLEGDTRPSDYLEDASHPLTYFLQMEIPRRCGPIKIGTTTRLAMRTQALATSSPYPLKLLAAYNGRFVGEGDMHEAFRRHRLRGEWFRPAPLILATAAILAGLNARGIR